MPELMNTDQACDQVAEEFGDRPDVAAALIILLRENLLDAGLEDGKTYYRITDKGRAVKDWGEYGPTVGAAVDEIIANIGSDLRPMGKVIVEIGWYDLQGKEISTTVLEVEPPPGAAYLQPSVTMPDCNCTDGECEQDGLCMTGPAAPLAATDEQLNAMHNGQTDA